MKSIVAYINESRKLKTEEQKAEGISVLDKVLNNDTEPIHELNNIIKINGPVIYAFITDKVENAIKIGYTDQHPEKRINQWRKKYGKDGITPLGYWSAEEIDEAGNKVFFWDHDVHKKVEKRGFLNIKKEEFFNFLSQKGKEENAIHEIYYSSEFFRKYRDILDDNAKPIDKEELSKDLLEDILNEMKKAIKEGKADFKLYNYETKQTADKSWKAPDTYSNTALQKDAIHKGVEAIKAGKKNLLMAAVMRFGKTHAAYEIIKESGMKSIIVASAKADVRTAWRNDINHTDFYKDFVFIEILNEYEWNITAYDEKLNILVTKTQKINDQVKSYILDNYKDKTVIYFFTLHDLAGSLTSIKNKHKDIFNKEFDMMVIDETHYGSHANSFGKVTGLNRAIDEDDMQDFEEEQKLAKESEEQIKKLNIKYKVMLQVSGTPYYILASNEMLADDAEIISKVSYTDMIEARDKWLDENENEDPTNSPYYGIPTLHKIGLNLNKECRKAIASSGSTDSLSALFKTTGNKFKYEDAIEKLMKGIFGDGSDDTLAFLKNKVIEVNKVCNHTIIVLPKITACEAMKELLNKIIDTSEREIICLVGKDSNIANVTELNNKLEELDNKNKKSIILTVYRFLTGVSMPLVDSMIYLKNCKTSQEYDQNIFRLCTRNVKKVETKNGPKAVNMKDNVYLIDFNIANMFKMMADTARKKAIADKVSEKGKADKIAEYMKQELDHIPLYCEDNTQSEILGKMRLIKPNDLMKVYANYNENKSVADITTSEMDLFDGLFSDKTFQDIMLGIDIDGDNSKIVIPDVNKDGNDSINVKSDDDSKDNSDDFKHLKDMAKDNTDKAKNEKIKITREKFQQICKNLMYCNLTLDNPYTDIEGVLQDKELENRLKDFEISIKDLEHIYKYMKPIYKECLNQMLLKVALLVKDIEKKGIKQYQKAMAGLGKIKKNEVVTPEEIVEKMINKLSKEDFEKADSILLVNEKQGEFLIGIYEKFGKKIAEKCKIVPSSSMTTYLIEKTLKHLGTNNYIYNIGDINSDGKYDIKDFLDMSNENILKENNGKKFSIILSNPPYDGSLHLKFLEKYIKLADKVISIQPATFLINIREDGKGKTQYIPLKNKLEHHVENCEIQMSFVKDMNIASYVPLTIITVNSKEEIKEFEYTISNSTQKVTSIYDCNKVGNYKTIKSIIDKCQNYGDMMKDHITNKKLDGDYKYLRFMSIITANGYESTADKVKTKFGTFYGTFTTPCVHKADNKLYDYVPNTKSGNSSGCVYGSEEELENWKYFAYNNKLPIFINIVMTIDQHNNSSKFIPWITDKKYSDNEIYDLLGITKDEQKLIDNTIEKFEWHHDYYKTLMAG